MAEEPRPYASSPCMLHELEDESAAVQIFYIYIIEQSDGFRWQVRGHELRDPIDTSNTLFGSAGEAREAGRPALEKACSQYRRFGLVR